MTVTLYHKRSYKGSFRTEIEAAREYDRRSILVYGIKVMIFKKTHINLPFILGQVKL